jgi:hypothetical protein
MVGAADGLMHTSCTFLRSCSRSRSSRCSYRRSLSAVACSSAAAGQQRTSTVRSLGAEDQLDDMDERLQRLMIENPAGADHLVIGREHYRSWRSRCLEALVEGYGDDFDDAVGAIAVLVGAFRHFRGVPTDAVTTAKGQALFRAVRVR